MAYFGSLMTAVITPFDEDLKVNFQKVEELVDHLIDKQTDGIVVSGTTGESPTINYEEKIELFKTVKQAADGRVKVIAGTGNYCTTETVELSMEAEKIGVDGIMLVTPYYSKPPQNGLFDHFTTVANSVDIPVILYNIPSRTGRNIEAETIIKLSEQDNIVAVKEASGNLDQVAAIASGTQSDFSIYSGDDIMTLPILSCGGSGVISVASHLVGPSIKKMIEDYFSGRVEEAKKMHLKLRPLFKTLFVNTNPIMLKEALNIIGLNVGSVRLPLTEANSEQKKLMRSTLSNLKLI